MVVVNKNGTFSPVVKGVRMTELINDKWVYLEYKTEEEAKQVEQDYYKFFNNDEEQPYYKEV